MSKKNLLSDTDYTSGRDNRFKNSVVIGRVSEINCDKVSTNVRVIMPDKVDHKGTPLVTKPIPVLQQASTAKKSFAVPRIGTNVAMIKMPNGTSDYLVVGGFYTTSDPPPVDDPMLDYVEYDDGSTMQFNASDGTLTWKLKGGIVIETDGDISFTTKGAFNVKADGTAKIEAALVHLKGPMKFEGDIDHQGGMITTKTHRDEKGLHSGGARDAELEARLAALEQRVANLEARHGS
jgi:phage baseplate assembly protein V